MAETKKISVILAAKTDFSVEKATAIDLYAHHYALVSRFKSNTIIVADAQGHPLPDVEFHNLGGARRIRRLRTILKIIAKQRPSILIVHQNVKYANALSSLVSNIPVVFVQHGLVDLGQGLSSYFQHRAFRNFSHIVCVSEAAKRRLVDAMADLDGRISVFPSGLDMREWRPAAIRLKRILVVGRCIPQKGILQAAIAIRQALQGLDDWSAEFILSLPAGDKRYVDDVFGIISAMGKRATLITNAQNDVVKSAIQRTAIAVVPSLGFENFARTALEAHAGGAALISSGCGALKEVSGDFACYVDPKNTVEMVQVITRLANDEKERADLAGEGVRRARELFDIRRMGAKMDNLLDHLSSDRTATIKGNVPFTYLKSKYLT